MRLTFKNLEKAVEEYNGHPDFNGAVILKKGVPDARYSSSYKYTLYYPNNFNIAYVGKTIADVIDWLRRHSR